MPRRSEVGRQLSSFSAWSLLAPAQSTVKSDSERLRDLEGIVQQLREQNQWLQQRVPYMRFGESNYGFLGKVYETQEFNPPAPGLLARLRAIIDEAFGRTGTGRKCKRLAMTATAAPVWITIQKR